MFVLDTNVISELRKVRRGNANAHVARWADTVEAVTLYISVVTVLELELGVLLMERRDAKQGRALRIWLDNHVLSEFADRILSVARSLPNAVPSCKFPIRDQPGTLSLRPRPWCKE